MMNNNFGLDVPNHVAKQIENCTMEEFEKNPFILLDYSQALTFSQVDEISGLDPSDYRRRDAAIMEILKCAIFGKRVTFSEYGDWKARISAKKKLQSLSGSTCIYKKFLHECAEYVLGEGIPDSEFNDSLSALFFSKKLEIEENYVYLPVTYKREFGIAEHISEHLRRRAIPPAPFLYRILEESMAETQIYLSLEQQDAVITAIENPFSVITGGPGTGKTSMEKVLINTYLRSFPEKDKEDILLLAPTGQAAQRMSDSIGLPAHTIHNALQVRAGEYVSTKEEALVEGLILVDESSMLDEGIFLLLMEYVSPTSRIVLIGDKNQLPSIAEGNILAELCKAKDVPIAYLTEVFRQKNNSIAFNAARILSGCPTVIEDDQFSFINVKQNELVDKTVNLYLKKVDEYGIDNVICLTPVRKFTDTGVNSLNLKIKSKINPEPEALMFGGKQFSKNDKVIFCENSSKLGLVNGSIGYIDEIDVENNSCTCHFADNHNVVIKGRNLKSLDLAYAQTVHKAQGQEYPCVIMLINEQHSNSLTNKLIYTAVTRAKKEFITILSSKSASADSSKTDEFGSRAFFNSVVSSKSVDGRCSRLSKLIKV